MIDTLIKNPVEQILDIYSGDDFWWVQEKTPVPMLRGYIWELIDRGNLFWASEDGRVVGLCETWKIDFKTLGEMVCKIDRPIQEINTTDGNIAIVQNVWIDKERRNGRVFKTMRDEWYRRHHQCEYYVGHAQRKSLGMYKSFKVSELSSGLFRNGF